MRRDDVGPVVQNAMQHFVAGHIEDRDSAAPDPRIDLLADAGILMAFDPRPELLPLGGDIGGAFGPRRRDDKEQHWYFPSGQSDAERSAKPVLQKHRIARRQRAWHGI